MVGPITVKTPEQLPADLEKFVSDSGGHGFIMVSFGSYVESVLAKEKINMLATALGKLKQNVIWRLKGECRYNILFVRNFRQERMIV